MKLAVINMKLAPLKSTPLNYNNDANQPNLAEIATAFIQHNQLSSRFENNVPFCICATSFNTGVHFLTVVKQWLNAPHSQQLHFIAFEKHPLDLSSLKNALQNHPGLGKMANELYQNYPVRLPGWHSLLLFNGRIKLTLWFGDVSQGLGEINQTIDAWFLEKGHSNPDLCQPAILNQLTRLSKPHTTFVSINPKDKTKQAFAQAGFEVNQTTDSQPQPEIIFGQLTHPRPAHSKTPWYALPNEKNTHPQKITDKNVIILGAGLAGATCAYELAERGWQVILLEKNAQPALEASGNLAGAIHPLVTADWNIRSQWYLRGFETTSHRLTPWLKAGKILGNLNGLVHLATTETTHKRIQDSLTRVGLPPEFAIWQTAPQLEKTLKTRINHPGLVFPNGGWVQPKSVVQTCLQHPNIQLITNFKAEKIIYANKKWLITPEQGTTLTTSTLIIATGAGSPKINQQFDLPVRAVKGQVTHLNAQQVSSTLPMAVTHEGYSVSLNNGEHLTGATFEAPDLGIELSLEAEQKNRNITQTALPDWITPYTSTSPQGKIGFRPASPDHLPIIGPVADPDFMQSVYLSQSHTHVAYRYPTQQYLPGLFVNNGHGARGLMSVFLAAEMLADMIEQTPLNMPTALYQATHPARFKIRAWRSGKLS